MSPENMWLVFACVAMSFFGYAFLKPMIKCSCCEKKPPPPPALPTEAAPTQYRTIKIHPERAKFRLFPPGEAYYVGGPPKKPPPPKKKKTKSPKAKILQDKFKACVNAIVISNAIRDANSASPNGETITARHWKAKDPQVFSGFSPSSRSASSTRGRAKTISLAGVVQLKRALSKAKDHLKDKNSNINKRSGDQEDQPGDQLSQNNSYTPPPTRPTSAFLQNGEIIMNVSSLQSSTRLLNPPLNPPLSHHHRPLTLSSQENPDRISPSNPRDLDSRQTRKTHSAINIPPDFT